MFVPGGQAPVVDLMQDAEVGEILRHFHARKKPTAFLCHGPMAAVAAMPKAREFRAALIAGDTAKAAELAKGWQYAGYKMTVFSATEEKVIEDNILHAKLYFNMPDALRTAGGDVSTTAVDFEPHVVEDRELITGQNPRSDKPIAAKLIQALDARRRLKCVSEALGDATACEGHRTAYRQARPWPRSHGSAPRHGAAMPGREPATCDGMSGRTDRSPGATFSMNCTWTMRRWRRTARHRTTRTISLRIPDLAERTAMVLSPIAVVVARVEVTNVTVSVETTGKEH